MSAGFILNRDQVKCPDAPSGMTLLDFIRDRAHLKGTKTGCREGDCGACTVLIGTLYDQRVVYENVTSCLMPLGNAFGKHVVTVEGLSAGALTQVQQALVDQGASQCGFCTPGFVLSMTGYCLSQDPLDTAHATRWIDGNICRCTGYKSIQRATEQILTRLQNKPPQNPLPWLVQEGFIPTYFQEIPTRLAGLAKEVPPEPHMAAPMVAGGTDLYVQRPETLESINPALALHQENWRFIDINATHAILGPATTVEDLWRHDALNQRIPGLDHMFKLISSTPIRHMATLAGNIVNASPIADLTLFLLAWNADLTLQCDEKRRVLPLHAFFKGYKTLDLKPGERITEIRFELPSGTRRFNFEKVSKRTHLDIASVNSAACFDMENDRIESARISAGGVAPIPLLLSRTAEFLKGQPVSGAVMKQAAALAMQEISPISDARGSAQYKSRLLGQLILAHFSQLFPERFAAEVTL